MEWIWLAYGFALLSTISSLLFFLGLTVLLTAFSVILNYAVRKCLQLLQLKIRINRVVLFIALAAGVSCYGLLFFWLIKYFRGGPFDIFLELLEFLIIVFAGLFLPSLFLIILLLFASFFFKKYDRYRPQAFHVMVTILIVFILPAVILVTSDPCYTENDRTKADTLRSALDTYKKENGEFPSTLEQLMPEYLEKIPNTCRSGEFNYYRGGDENKGYRLSYYEGALITCDFDTEENQWRCDD